MSNEVAFDFVCDTAVAVVAEAGTDPKDLEIYAVQQLIQKLLIGEAEVHCDNIYDPETGLHSIPENYEV